MINQQVAIIDEGKQNLNEGVEQRGKNKPKVTDKPDTKPPAQKIKIIKP